MLHLLVQSVDDADGKLGVARMAADLRELLLAEFEAAQCGEVLLELCHAVDTAEGEVTPVAQHPGDRRLGERLPTPASDRVQGAQR